MPATVYRALSLSIQPAKSCPTVSPAKNTSVPPRSSPISTPFSPALAPPKSPRVNNGCRPALCRCTAGSRNLLQPRNTAGQSAHVAGAVVVAGDDRLGGDLFAGARARRNQGRGRAADFTGDHDAGHRQLHRAEGRRHVVLQQAAIGELAHRQLV